MKTCSKCGNTTNDDSKFCEVCGMLFPNPLLEEKRKELKLLEKRMDRGGAIIAASFAFFAVDLFLILSSVWLPYSYDIGTLLFWGVPGIILFIFGFVIFGDSFSESKRIKEEYPILIVSENKIKKH